jgi:hypothetical protein
MAIRRKPICTKHKPQMYKHQCPQCIAEFNRNQLILPGITTKEVSDSDNDCQVKEDNDATTDDNTVAE